VSELGLRMPPPPKPGSLHPPPPMRRWGFLEQMRTITAVESSIGLTVAARMNSPAAARVTCANGGSHTLVNEDVVVEVW